MAQNILAKALATSTRAGYRSAINHIATFHEKRNSQFNFPVSSDTLCLWMADSITKLKYPSIRNYLHGIATTQQELGFCNPLQSPSVWRMFKGIKRVQGAEVVRKRLPITIKILTHINHLIDTNNENDLCMRAAMWLGTCGLLRAGEFTTKSTSQNTLKFQHLTFLDYKHNELDPLDLEDEPPHYMTIRLEQSKTDPFRHGTSVVIGNRRAIEYMIVYLTKRKQVLNRQPLFVGANGLALTTAALVRFVQSLIARGNIANAHLFLGHSFRKGGATSLHEAGHPDSLIKQMGRWTSFAFATYIDTPLKMLIDAGRSLTKVDEVDVGTNNAFWDVNNLQ
jgi:hypothetical protein